MTIGEYEAGDKGKGMGLPLVNAVLPKSLHQGRFALARSNGYRFFTRNGLALPVAGNGKGKVNRLMRHGFRSSQPANKAYPESATSTTTDKGNGVAPAIRITPTPVGKQSFERRIYHNADALTHDFDREA